ncbi:LytR C-terminal domain-containing protein [Corynebacterium sp. H113]|uniref:LytR C-terminal domain-containing protein n=1 Tax=Corynebacterium sp. H113 TaxID=3133419 RepID=UPI0030AF9223
MSEQNFPPRHPRPGRHRMEPNEAYDDDFVEEPAPSQAAAAAPSGASTAAPAGASATGATAAGAGAATPSSTGAGLPLRNLALVLIFIGVCLVGYGIYAFATNDSNDGTTNVNSDAVAANDVQNAPGDSGQAPAVGADNAGAPNNGAAQNPAGQPGNPAAVTKDAANPGNDATPGSEGSNGEANGTAEEGAVDRNVPVTVLNNSMRIGLAEEQAEKLSDGGWKRVESGNLPEANGIWEKTTVHYTAGNDVEKRVAETIAEENGWEVAERGAGLDGTPGGVLVVVTEDAL